MIMPDPHSVRAPRAAVHEFFYIRLVIPRRAAERPTRSRRQRKSLPERGEDAVDMIVTGGDTIKQGSPAFAISGGLVHVDHPRLQGLFAKHHNVKACLSGHLHIVERIEFAGVSYFCNGAVSAGWWKGTHRGTDFGYAVINLHRDGTIASRYVPYGWTPA